MAEAADAATSVLSPADYVAAVFFVLLTKVEIIKAVQALLMCMSYLRVTDKSGKQKKATIFNELYKDYQDRVSQTEDYQQYVPQQYWKDFSPCLLFSRGTQAFTAESLWTKMKDICKDLRKLEPMYLRM
jgi:hypothetical protein